MLKKLLIVVLLPLHLLTVCHVFLPFVEYALHRDYIAQNLCENRDTPELQCNGKCHLQKEVQQQEKKEQQEGSKERVPTVDWNYTILSLDSEPFISAHHVVYPTIEYSTLSATSIPPFHPPRS